MPFRAIQTLRVAEVYSSLETSPEGLSSGEAEARFRMYGPNALPAPVQMPVWRRILIHLNHPMALALWSAGLIALVNRNTTLAGIIWFVVAINEAFSYWQEHRAEVAVSNLSHLLPSFAQVMRDGKEKLITTGELVPGDVLILEQGNNIPADARVVEQYGLRANQSTLTGEAVPAVKAEVASLRDGLTDLERPNLIFAGSSVVSGTARAVVFATGSMTQFGRIARLSQTVQEGPSRLQQEIIRLTRWLSLMAVAVALIVFGVGIMEVGLGLAEAFILAIGILVAALPEGLRPTLTLSLAIAVQRLARKGVLVKKLATMETLGKISVICTDKSGTLTHNQMTVKELWVSGQRVRVTGAGYEPVGEFKPANGGLVPTGDLCQMLTAALLCNNARLLRPNAERSRWSAMGDQTEAALRVAAFKAELDDERLEKLYPRVHELPFEASRKRMSTIHRNGTKELAFVKGAPREVLQQCTHILMKGEVRPLDDETRTQVMKINDNYARRALRVLAVARRELPPREGVYTPDKVEQTLTFLGLAAMMDPPRAEVATAMETLRSAGVRVVMITGDYGLTGESVARRVGMLSSGRARIITGADLDAMTDDELRLALGEEVLFARVAPEHKLRVVAAFESLGESVAVIGDGVNDAPALRKADIGIAMGRAGTDVAREAADVILTDDNFAALVSALAEGRAIVRNIRKFMTYILASNVPEIMPFMLAAIFDLPLALTVVQILAIDLGTDLLPALALGAEQPEPDILRGPPQRRDQRLLDGSLVGRALWLGGLETLLCYAGFLAVLALGGHVDGLVLPWANWSESLGELALSGGSIESLAQTTYFAGVVTAQAANALACRRERPGVHELGWFSNRLLIAGIGLEILLALSLIYLPPLDAMFGLVALPPILWAGLAGNSILLYVLDRIRKSLALWLGPKQKPLTIGGTRV